MGSAPRHIHESGEVVLPVDEIETQLEREERGDFHCLGHGWTWAIGRVAWRWIELVLFLRELNDNHAVEEQAEMSRVNETVPRSIIVGSDADTNIKHGRTASCLC